MRIAGGILVLVGLVATVAGCWRLEPSSSATPTSTAAPTLGVSGSAPVSSFPLPGPTRKPGIPSPTMEIPPPPD